jgi:hypothetical protein
MLGQLGCAKIASYFTDAVFGCGPELHSQLCQNQNPSFACAVDVSTMEVWTCAILEVWKDETGELWNCGIVDV